MRILIFLVLIGAACTPVYIPNSRSVPSFQEGGQIALDGYAGSSGFDLNVGASLTDHLAVIGNLSYQERNELDSGDYHKHRFWEAGLGYFNHDGGKFNTEFFAGYGRGEATSFDEYTFFTPTEELATGNYNRIFFQSNLTFSPGSVELGLAARMSYVTFTKFETSSTSISRRWSTTFLEPAFFFKVGDPVHFNMQAGFNLPFENSVAFDYHFFHFSIGVGARINLSKK